MPNTFAYLVFWGWPLVILWLLINYPIKYAIFTAIILSILLLPAGFTIDPPLLPPLNRETITSMSLVIFLFLLGKKLRISKSGVIVKLIVCYLGIILLSSLLNETSIMAGGKFLPGLTFYDAFSSIVQTLIWIIPFFLGRYFFNNVKDNEEIFKILVLLALLYSLPMLYEFRFSPQLHRIVYGYHATDFVQQVRSDGFRATVFVGHGLALAFIISTCSIAAIALHKNKVRVGKLSPIMVIFYLSVLLILSATWSALFYVSLAALFIYMLTPSKQIKWALLIAAIVLLYPVGKILQIIPEKEIISTISEYNTDRGQSLEFRFQNEEVLLIRALERPFFGWGGWGRNRVYDNTGKDLSVTDGAWIIEFGIYGVLGFLFHYLILLTPLYYAVKNVKYIKESKDQVYFAALAVILASCLIDSVPNAGMTSIHMLLAGALLGQSEFLKKQKNLPNNERVISG
jgi:hypothetical protein